MMPTNVKNTAGTNTRKNDVIIGNNESTLQRYTSLPPEDSDRKEYLPFFCFFVFTILKIFSKKQTNEHYLELLNDSNNNRNINRIMIQFEMKRMKEWFNNVTPINMIQFP